MNDIQPYQFDSQGTLEDDSDCQQKNLEEKRKH